MKKDRMKPTTDKAERALAQHAALCYRESLPGAAEILLITSRDTGRWVLPKGWPKKGELGSTTALREAREEAGVEGTAAPESAGLYAYDKIMPGDLVLPCIVTVHPVEVSWLRHEFPECAVRQREWFSTDAAAAAVDEPELKAILANFSPASARGSR